MKKITVVAALLALPAACGGDPDLATAAGSAPATTGAVVVEPIPTTAPAAMPTSLTEDLIFHPGGEPFSAESGLVDVIAPTVEGPWPTVVVFHGDPRFATKTWHRSDAGQIAEQGRVVFLPSWGHTTSAAAADMGLQSVWEMTVQELSCAVLYAQAHTEEYGGDPEHITLYGLSAGGNAVLMAGLAGADPLESCSVSGGPVQPQALVPIDADWTLGGSWDTQIQQNPEVFYALTPWRHLDGSQDIPIHVTVAENPGSYTRSVEPDPTASWLSYRHSDIDLPADLDARGFLADGEFSLKESSEYAVEILHEEGYQAKLVVMPGATHEIWGTAGTATVVDTVLHAEEGANPGTSGTLSISVEDWAGVEGYRLMAGVWSDDYDLVGASFWTIVDSDPFSVEDGLHPLAVPPGDEQPWGLGDYLWDKTMWLDPGTYRIEFWANPGELPPYGNYIPSDGIERSCWVDVEVRDGEVSKVVISDIPRGHGLCPDASS
jgi:hypothetical protein